MAKYLTEAMIVMRLMWVKVLLICFIPFGMSLTQQTETWSGETWDSTHWFMKSRVLFVAGMQAAIALYGFFDKTSQRVEAELAKHRAEQKIKDQEANTQFIEKL